MAALTPQIIATWPIPQYDHPKETLTPVIWGVEITMIILMTSFMFGRFYSRTVLVKGALSWDDWIMLFSYVLALGLAIEHIWEVNVGIGRHLYDVKFAWIPGVGKASLATEIMFGPTTAATKISICLTYLRLFPSKTNKWFNYVSITVLTCWGITCALVMSFMCLPISDQWDITKTHKNCIDIQVFFIAAASINAATDCLVYMWPIHYLMSVNMPLRQRLGLTICFSVGVIVCVAGLVRVYYMTIFFKQWDQTWYGAIIFICLAFETDLGIICGCIPGVRPIFSKVFPKILRTSANRSNGNSSGNRAWNKNMQKKQSSSAVSSQGYKDLDSIHVTKDIELSVVSTPGAHWRESESERPLRGPGNEEWAKPEWNYRT